MSEIVIQAERGIFIAKSDEKVLELLNQGANLSNLSKRRKTMQGDHLLKVAGKTFRCDCGSNVFRLIDTNHWQCSGCLETYTSEPEEVTDRPTPDLTESQRDAQRLYQVIPGRRE